jgi:beta-xylosidase
VNASTNGADQRLCRRAFVAASGAAATTILAAGGASAQPSPRPVRLKGLWGDQGDGRFVNPILPADYSDIDVIQAGDRYVAISSTLHTAPGMVVMESTDLVNWDVLGHAVDDIAPLGENLSWRRMDGYGRGVWAGALRFHNGRFHLYFTCPDSGLYVTSAERPRGPWTPLRCLWAVSGHNDPCPFWDDDGQAYLVMTRFAPDPVTNLRYSIFLYRLSADGRAIDIASAREIHRSNGSEASKLYKFGGRYYHYFSEVRPEGRVAMMRRSSSLNGPWEERQLNHVAAAIDKEPNQGGLVQARDGAWWFLTHQGTGDWAGRALCLLPVRWIDGWPILGEPGADGIGAMVWSCPSRSPDTAAGPSLPCRTISPPARSARNGSGITPRARRCGA